MSAIYGIFGEAVLAEVHQMGGRLAHLGTESIVWSVSDHVHFGQRCFPRCGSSLLPPAKPMVFGGFIDNREDLTALLGWRGVARREDGSMRLAHPSGRY
jgi:hypothetical protein